MREVAPIIRFGLFEVHLEERMLAKDGRKIKLQDQPFRVLEMLLEEPGNTVTRERLKEVLWPADTFVDFDHSLNAAVAKLRQALDDSADNPRFVATQARRGYRFIAPVEKPVRPEPVPEPQARRLAHVPHAGPPTVTRKRNRLSFALVAAVTIAALAGVAVWISRSKDRGEQQIIQITFNPGLTIEPAISPDGKLLAYASDRGGSPNLNIWLQQLSSDGSAIQLTREDGDTRQPSFSPDGSRIIFRCASRGGICAIPAIGGDIVRLAPEGWAPRFSPDGKWISYQVGVSIEPTSTGRIEGPSFVMPSGGGPARQIGADLFSANEPVWSPDSQYLLVRGATSASGAPDRFIVPIVGGHSRPTGIYNALLRQGFRPPTSYDSFAVISQWSNGYVFLSAAFGDANNVWRMPVSAEGHPTGKAQRLTFGTEIESSPVMSPDGTLFFASSNLLFSIWSLPIDADRARVRGGLRRITAGPSDFNPSLSRDGKLMAFSTPPGVRRMWQNAQVFVRDLVSGREDSVTRPGTLPEASPHLSSDGLRLATVTMSKQTIQVMERRDLSSRRSLGPGHPWDWSHDDRLLLYTTDTTDSLLCVDVSAGKQVFELGDPGHKIYQARFAPDDRFITAEIYEKEGKDATSRVVLAPFRENAPVSPNELIWINQKPHVWDDKPRWSPDGNLLYFVSNRDGHLCLWAQRLRTVAKQPDGEPFPVWHFHSAALSIENIGAMMVGVDTAVDKIVFGIGESTGNIWSIPGNSSRQMFP